MLILCFEMLKRTVNAMARKAIPSVGTKQELNETSKPTHINSNLSPSASNSVVVSSAHKIPLPYPTKSLKYVHPPLLLFQPKPRIQH